MKNPRVTKSAASPRPRQFD